MTKLVTAWTKRLDSGPLSGFGDGRVGRLGKIARVLSMARFSSEVELETFLGELDPDYSQFASALWQKGVKTARQLAMLQSHFYYLGVCQSCTSMTSKPQLIGQNSRCQILKPISGNFF
ncbi:hypothetical protein ABBQ32_007756 [Trebouxia sp. C0010 RCD-2024]